MAGEAKELVVGGMLYQCSANVKNRRKSEGLPAVARVKKRPGNCIRPGPVDDTHAAFAELREDLVVGNNIADHSLHLGVEIVE